MFRPEGYASPETVRVVRRMGFESVAKVAEIASGKMKKVTVKGQEILIVNVNGKYYAMESACSHMKTDLSGGTLDSNILTCPKHGQRFDVTTGRSVLGPKIAFVKMKGKDLTRYDVKIEGDNILVNVE